MSNDLLQKKCVPCEGGAMPLTGEEIAHYMIELKDWKLENGVAKNPEPKQAWYGARISKVYKFKDFIGAINFVNHVAEITEGEGHHPDILINYNKVKLVLSTHAIGGLSENDFILAAKIDASK